MGARGRVEGKFLVLLFRSTCWEPPCTGSRVLAYMSGRIHPLFSDSAPEAPSLTCRRLPQLVRGTFGEPSTVTGAAVLLEWKFSGPLGFGLRAAGGRHLTGPSTFIALRGGNCLTALMMGA